MSQGRFRGIVEAWNHFWFESGGSEQMRLFRVGIGATLLCCYLERSFDLDFFYSGSGLVGPGVLEDLIPMHYRFSVLDWFPGNTSLWIFNLVFLAALGTLTLGFFPRLSAWVAFVLHVSFLHRNPIVAIGVDMVATFYLFYLGLADSRGLRDARKTDFRSVLGSMAFRLCQVQLCVIYGYSGIQKLKGLSWWKGEGVWGALSNPQWARWDFSGLAQFPLILTLASFACLFWEIYFPAFIWVRALRYPVLAFGVLMHLGIGLSMNIPIFAALMIASYSLFLDAEHADKIFELLKNPFDFIQVQKRTAE